MKRPDNLFGLIVDDENIGLAIEEVNRTHRWKPGHKPNKTTLWVESTKEERVQELKNIILDGFKPAEPKHRTIYDEAAGKWRDIYEPRQYPDQYVHHAIIQVLQPIIMRKMDKWCCGSIRGRGMHYGANALKKWMKVDKNGTRYAAELDIKQFYPSILTEYVMARLRQLIKCRKTLDLVELILQKGVMIGFYYSQWFANMLLQPLDKLIRDSGYCAHYIRYMDNITVTSNRKRNLHKLVKLIMEWLSSVKLRLKENWQVFKTTARRNIDAVGFRIAHGYTFLRKKTLLRLMKKLRQAYRALDDGRKLKQRLAESLVCRIGQLKHCNSSAWRKNHIRQNFVKMLKNIIRKSKEGMESWDIALRKYMDWKCLSL